VRAAALPHGYAIVTWTSGGVLIHTHGLPDLLAAYLFLAGAVTGFGAAVLLAGRGESDAGAEERWGAVTSVVAAAAALACAGLVAGAVPGRLAYFAVALLGSLVYFAVRAAGTAYL
jgi:hypothetical protein